METLNIYTPNQIENIEKAVINNYGITQDLLMENSAHALLNLIHRKYMDLCSYHIICGPGNNGGDGLALAKLLDSENRDVTVSFLYNPNYIGASQKNYILTGHIPVLPIETLPDSKNCLIVDALFGIGLNRQFDEKTTEVIKRINSSKSPVLSVDIPSGISGIDGEVVGGVSVKADDTVTFIGYKTGMFSSAFEQCGEISLSKISISDIFLDKFPSLKINQPINFQERGRNSHKTSNGKILTVAGSNTYYGAPYFASKAAMLSGAGFSVLISDEDINRVCASLAPEVIYRRDDDLETSINSSSTVVVGPGIGLSQKSLITIKKVIQNSMEKLIIDADGLTLMADNMELFKDIKAEVVITPHPGEMARLTGKSIKEVESNRLEVAKKLAMELGVIVVLKGPFTIIATPQGELFLNNNSSVTLATAGSGDVLCGIIAGLSGTHSLLDSVRAGVYIHGTCGIMAENEIGVTGVTATDILGYIPAAVNEYKRLNR